MDILQTVVLPLGLGFLGFIEPCSVGASLLFLWHVERAPPATRVFHAAVFMVVRAGFIGALGAIAALVGTQFFGLQRLGWIALGTLYALLGLAYMTGRAGILTQSFGPNLRRATNTRSTIALGVLFGMNIPACAAPLLLALLGTAAVRGAEAGHLAQGFVSLAIFGLALSLPLTIAVLYRPMQRVLSKLLEGASRWPTVIGALLVGLGLWSVYFGIAVDPAGAQ
jgi:cytochrome c-type biogenesis protein